MITGAGPVGLLAALIGAQRGQKSMCSTTMKTAESENSCVRPGHDFCIDVGALNRTMVLNNDTVFGAVNANRTHYEMAGRALKQADKAWLSRLITRRAGRTMDPVAAAASR